MLQLIFGVLLPFLGTTLGSFLVFFMRNSLNKKVENILLGFSAGVMLSASVWSLIIPAIDLCDWGKLSFFPAVIGIVLGCAFLLVLDIIIPKLKSESDIQKSNLSKVKRQSKLVLAVTLHNIPEGMAVGVALAGAYFGGSALTIASSIALSVGIAIQNVPEGAIISMPLKSKGYSKLKAFILGVLSGVVEPIFAIITILLTGIVTPILPYLLTFSAGTMLYVVAQELIPESQNGDGKIMATISFIVGFLLMMILDIALG